MFIDYTGRAINDGAMFLGGRPHGSVGESLAGVRFEPGLLRPYLVYQNGRNLPHVTVNTGRTVRDEKGNYVPERKSIALEVLARRGVYSPVANATSLRKEQWIELDRVVRLVARERLRAWADLAAANTFGGFDAMARSTLEYEAMSDPGEAVVDMDALTPGRIDSPLFKLRSMPLPIIHSDFWFSERRLAESRSSGSPLDTTMAEACSRRVAEMIEKTVIGVTGGVSGFAYGGQTTGVTAHDTSGGLGASTVYGYTTFPHRSTKTNMTVPTSNNPDATVDDVLAMRNTLYGNKYYGPFMAYHSTDWDRYLDDDYFTGTFAQGLAAPAGTLRDRLKRIEGIQDVRRLDFLTSTFTMILVQMTADVARAVNGMDITTVQWEENGGMKKLFKVMAIQVPQLRSDYNNLTGILHGTTT